MKKGFIALLASFIVIASFSMGWAALLNIVPSNYSDINDSEFAGSLPDINSHFYVTPEGSVKTAKLEGWYNANLYALEDVNLTYEYLGSEASWRDKFKVDKNDELEFINTRSKSGDQFSSFASVGSMPVFRFTIITGPIKKDLVRNSKNRDPDDHSETNSDYGAPNFFLGYADDFHNSVYIALDDGGGRVIGDDVYVDGDYDDLVVKVTATSATPVPEPATLILLGAGLIGLAGFGRKKLLKN